MPQPIVAIAALACVASSTALAQATPAVHPGDRVRVRSTVAPARARTGQVGAIDADTLLLQGVDGVGATTAIPLASIERLEVSRGRHSKWQTGLGIGFAVGAVTGAIVGAASHNENDFLFTSEMSAAAGALVFAPIGAVLGAVVGSLTRPERWKTVPLTRSGAALDRRTGSRLTLGLSVVF